MADKKGPAANGAVSSNAGAENLKGISRKGPRAIALVGPFQSGKTTLLEAILARTGAIARAGSVDAGTSVGDAGAESRAHKMSVEMNVASAEFLGDTFHFIDCPGSVEFAHEMRAAVPAVDAAVVVCEADPRKTPQLQLVMRELEAQGIPRFLFINKIDKAERRLRETLALLQPVSRIPLVLRQIPIWRDGIVVGFVDLALERAFIYREHAASEVVDLDGENASREKDARFTMLETIRQFAAGRLAEEPDRDQVRQRHAAYFVELAGTLVATLDPSRFDLSPLVRFESWQDLEALRSDPPHPVIEGVMLKRRDSIYVAGRPKGPWWKWKREPYVVDAVMMYAQRGHGKRSSFYSDYTFGVWRDDEIVPVGKAYFGFTDEELKRLDKFVRDNTVDRFGPVRQVAFGDGEGLVLEVAFEGLNRSTRHKSGVAMRFPRIHRIRWDKPAAEADRLETLEAMLPAK